MYKKFDIISIQKSLKTKILTPEGEILFILHEQGCATASEIIKKSKYSHGCIFQKLRDLDEAGLVTKIQPDGGRKAPQITLSQLAKTLLSGLV